MSVFSQGGPELRGIFIKNLLNGGPAASDGRIAKGDRIVEINAVSLDGLTKQQVSLNMFIKYGSVPYSLTCL